MTPIMFISGSILTSIIIGFFSIRLFYYLKYVKKRKAEEQKRKIDLFVTESIRKEDAFGNTYPNVRPLHISTVDDILANTPLNRVRDEISALQYDLLINNIATKNNIESWKNSLDRINYIILSNNLYLPNDLFMLKLKIENKIKNLG